MLTTKLSFHSVRRAIHFLILPIIKAKWTFSFTWHWRIKIRRGHKFRRRRRKMILNKKIVIRKIYIKWIHPKFNKREASYKSKRKYRKAHWIREQTGQIRNRWPHLVNKKPHQFKSLKVKVIPRYKRERKSKRLIPNLIWYPVIYANKKKTNRINKTFLGLTNLIFQVWK